MKPDNLSIRTRFILLLIGSVLFWLVAGFIALSLMENLSQYRKVDNQIRFLRENLLRLENSIQYFYAYDLPSDSFHESGRSEGSSRFDRVYLNIYTHLGELKGEPLFSSNSLLRQKSDRLLEYLKVTEDLKEDLVEKSRQRGRRVYGLNGVLSRQMENLEPVDITGFGQLWQELTSDAQEYLVSPESVQLNALLSRINALESLLTRHEGQRVHDAGTASLMSWLANMRRLLQMDRELGSTPYEGLQSHLFGTLQILHEEANAMEVLFSIEMGTRIRRIRWGMICLILLSASAFGIALYLFSRSLARRLHSLKDSIARLDKGQLPGNILLEGKDELTLLTRHLNEYVQSLKDKSAFAALLARGEDPGELQALGPEDGLAHSLINLEKNLRSARMEEEKHKKSGEERRWISEGIARFGDILRVYNKNISSLSENVIQSLVNYLDASAGGIFLVSQQEEEPVLELEASFAFDRKKYLERTFRFGEGLVGTCAIEKEKIFLTEIPDDYIQIPSGLGDSKPSCLLLIPLQFENAILGVIEIASLRVFKDFEIEFVENLAESIAGAVSTVRMNMRTAQLLEQSQQQAKEMAEQREIMRKNMEELQSTQEESARRESEISGILNGIHNTSLVAEFNMEEELISINDKFLQLLVLQRSQMLGKRYNEMVGINRNTDSYRQFWQEISSGKTLSRIDKVPVFTGESVWLRQTFTPILDNNGNPFKVLLIASDITETIEQKESIEKQSNEIKRANIEMKSFSDAVDLALIKCVYSPAGQILEVNENFENVTGFTRKELLGKNNRVFLKRIEKEQFDKIWEDVLKDKPYSGVIRRTRPTGEEVWIMSTFTPVRDENGNVFKVYFLGQDITERKLKYQLLEEANREIDRLHKQLNEKR